MHSLWMPSYSVTAQVRIPSGCSFKSLRESQTCTVTSLSSSISIFNFQAAEQHPALGSPEKWRLLKSWEVQVKRTNFKFQSCLLWSSYLTKSQPRCSPHSSVRSSPSCQTFRKWYGKRSKDTPCWLPAIPLTFKPFSV